jgi:sulfatase modifying factor 1
VIRGLVLSLALLSCAPSHQVRAVEHKYYTDPYGIKFVFVPAGRFTMGGRMFGPIHNVELDGFWMSVYEITNKQFESFHPRTRPGASVDDNQPASKISYEAANTFAQELSSHTSDTYMLPTDAQWEYAARGGLEGKDFPWGNEPVDGRAKASGLTAMPVGSFAPNGFGLFDMAGNVVEHVLEADYEYSRVLDQKKNPIGPTNGKFHILRGGGFGHWNCEVFLRSLSTSLTEDDEGVRLVLTRQAKQTLTK